MGLTIDGADPKGDAGKEQQTYAIDQETAQKLIEDLEKVGVTTQKDLQNKLTASREAGNLANLYGETKRELEALKLEIANQRNTRPQRTEDVDIFSTFEQQEKRGATVEEIMEALDRRETKRMNDYNRQRQAVMSKYNTIVNERHYPLVKPLWEKRMQDPNFAQAVDTGQIDPVVAYQGLVVDFLSGVTQNTLKTLKGVINTPGATEKTVPHVESGGKVQPSPRLPGFETKTDPITQTRQHVDSGGTLSYDDELDIVGSIFGQSQ